MENLKIGFIGGGAMAEAIIGGVVGAGLLQSQQIFAADHKADRCRYLSEKYGIHASTDVQAFLQEIDMLFLAVKPQVADAAIEEVRDAVGPHVTIVSIIAGLSLAALEAHFAARPVVRVMPNTPVAVGAGMSALSLGKHADAKIGEIVLTIFSAVGKALILPEKSLDAVTGLSGSGPGYAFVMIDALADAGVKAGLPRKTAILLAAQTLLGAAQMVLKTGEHPAVLRDQVTSPGGTTIAGIHVMEEKGVRAALIAAVEASAEKSKAMGKK